MVASTIRKTRRPTDAALDADLTRPLALDEAYTYAQRLYAGCTPAQVEQLLDPTVDGLLRVRPTRQIGRAKDGAQASVLGTCLTWVYLGDDELERCGVREMPFEERLARAELKCSPYTLQPLLHFWTAVLAVFAWRYCGADPSTYPRDGYRPDQGQGWWYGPSDVRQVRDYLEHCHDPAVIEELRTRLWEAWQVYRRLCKSPGAFGAQIRWALHHIDAAYLRHAA